MGSNNFKIEKMDNYKNYSGQLKDQYKTIFEKIELYINGTAKLNEKEKNDCLLQILDTFLCGQAENRDVRDITGSKLKNYCDSMIYGEAIYIFKALRVLLTVIGALFYITFMQFFIKFCKVTFSKEVGNVFQPMNFGIGDAILFLSYMCIPYIIAEITNTYFENPVRCIKIRRYAYYGVTLLSIALYTTLKDAFQSCGIYISFSNIIFIFVFLLVVAFVVDYVAKAFEKDKTSDNQEIDNKYNLFLQKKYGKYKENCRKRNKPVADWDNFMKIDRKRNIVFTILFLIYGIIFFAFMVLTVRGVLIKGATVAEIIIFLICCFLDLVMFGIVKEGIRRNKLLFQK